MKRLQFQLDKTIIIFYLIGGLSILSFLRSCKTTKETIKLRKEIVKLSTKIDSLNAKIYDKEELDTRLAIEGYEISKRILYDQNAIVRTVLRPDDRMYEYDLEIANLRKKLKDNK